MPVEIQILSGARKGEQLRLNSHRIVVGDQIGCDVRFLPEHEPAVRDKRVLIELKDDGWFISNVGAHTWWVNQTQLVEGNSIRLRSGDIVRVSEVGPDFRFSIVSRQAASATSEAQQLEANPKATVATASEHSPGKRHTKVFQSIQIPLPYAMAVALPIIAVVVFLVVMLRPPDPVSSGANGRGEQSETSILNNSRNLPAPPKNGQSHSGNGNKAQPKIDPPTGKPLSLSFEQIAKNMEAAVVWIGFEAEGYKIPFCSGWVIRPQLVVSTAREIAELKEAYEEGESVFVYTTAPERRLISVTQFKLHGRFKPDDPLSSESLLHNVGVLTLEQPLSSQCPITTSEDFKGGAIGMEVTVLGYSISHGDSLKPYDRLSPPPYVHVVGQVTDTKTMAGAGADDLPLLELEVDTQDGMVGGPVLDREGRTVGTMLRVDDARYAVLSDHLRDLIP